MPEGVFIECLAQPQANESALVSEHLKAIQQTLVDHVQLESSGPVGSTSSVLNTQKHPSVSPVIQESRHPHSIPIELATVVLLESSRCMGGCVGSVWTRSHSVSDSGIGRFLSVGS